MPELNQLEPWVSFRNKTFTGRIPNKRTAKRKIRAGVWPGRIDADDEVYIYSERFRLGLKAPETQSDIDLAVEEFLNGD